MFTHRDRCECAFLCVFARVCVCVGGPRLADQVLQENCLLAALFFLFFFLLLLFFCLVMAPCWLATHFIRDTLLLQRCNSFFAFIPGGTDSWRCWEMFLRDVIKLTCEQCFFSRLKTWLYIGVLGSEEKSYRLASDRRYRAEQQNQNQ